MFIDFKNLSQNLKNFKKGEPFHHCVIDNFFHKDIARKLSKEFPAYDSKEWYVYKNAIENKKASNNWNLFPEITYKVLTYLSSQEFASYLSESFNKKLYPDIGLHGGGWHIHSNGGNLNPHLDYSIHPKLRLQRKINLIIYLSELMTKDMGGEFGLWSGDSNAPNDLAKTVQPLFNRAVIFDTTQNSWHGMVNPVTCPSDVYRQSMAVYYLCDLEDNADSHERALFAPRDNQKGDEDVENLIEKRYGIQSSHEVYRDDEINSNDS